MAPTPYNTGPFNDDARAAEYDTVKGMLPLITPYTLADDTTGQRYYLYAADQTTNDAPTISPAQRVQAICYYIAHLMEGKNGGYGITSEKIGQCAVTMSATQGTSQWMAVYKKLVNSSGMSAAIASSGAVIHEDALLAAAMNLDTTGGGL